MQIKQGDSYKIPIALSMDGQPIPADTVNKIELYFGSNRKLYPGDMTFADGVLSLPLTQQDTLKLNAGARIPIDIRIKFNSGDVYGIPTKMSASIADAVSTEVL